MVFIEPRVSVWKMMDNNMNVLNSTGLYTINGLNGEFMLYVLCRNFKRNFLDHIASKWRRWDSNPCLSGWEISALFYVCLYESMKLKLQ